MGKGLLIWILVFLSIICLVFATNSVTQGDLTLNSTQQGNISFSTNELETNISILQNSIINFTATVSNNSVFLSNQNVSCYLNLSTESELKSMSYNNFNFSYLYQFNDFLREGNYSIYCNNSETSIASLKTSFTVYPELLPKPIFIISYENVLPYELIEETLYVRFINISSGSEELVDSADYCLANVNGTTYNLTKEVIDGNTTYTNSSVIFPNAGNESLELSCINDGISYPWNWTIEVKEYASDFEDYNSSFDFGSAFDQNKALNVILSNPYLYLIHSEFNYSLFKISENVFNHVYSNINIFNNNGVVSLSDNQTITSLPFRLNEEENSRIHSIFNQSESTVLNSNFTGIEYPFLTTFDTNNDGSFETIASFKKDSSIQEYLININGSSSNLNIHDFYRGFFCYEDFNQDGYFDLLVSGSNSDESATRSSELYIYNGSEFELNRTLPFGLQWGSCHISKFLENNKTNILLTGVNNPEGNKIFLFDDLTFENEISAERLPINGLFNSDIFVADFDNDGLKDIIMCGVDSDFSTKRTYYLKQNQSNPGYFYEQEGVFNHPDVSSCSISASHLDDNSGLDVAIGGLGNSEADNEIKVYLNTPPQDKPNPEAPNITNISYNAINKTLYIEWNETHPIHSYNLKVIYANGTPIMSGFYPLSTHPAQGYLGNMRYRTNFTLRIVEHNLVTVGIQSFDESLRKSEWTEESITCDPPKDSSEWLIESYCPVSNSTLDAYNIIVTETGNLEILSNEFESNQTNITVNGEFSGNSLKINSFIYNSTNNLSDVIIDADSTIISNNTFTNISFSNVSISGNVTFIDSIIEPTILSDGYAQSKKTTTFSYQDQFGNLLTKVTQNTTGIQSTNTSLLLLHRIYEFEFTQNYTYQTTFNKSGYYNKSQEITPNASVIILLNKYPLPVLSGFDISLTSNLSITNISNIEADDIDFFSNLSNFRIGKEQIGQINFLEPVNLSYRYLSQSVIISNNSIFVNDSGLNRRANITFFNLSYEETPLIYKDGSKCLNCSNISYDGENVSATVDGFSNYTTTANAILTYESPSIIITDTNYTFLVKYVNASNTSQIIEGAECNLNISGDVFNLSLNDSFYQNQTIFTSVGNKEISVNCDAEGFENLTITETARVVSSGKYFLLDESYDSLSISSAGFDGNTLYYHGYVGSFFQQYIQNQMVSKEDLGVNAELDNPKTFSLTDLNNDGSVEKITLGKSAPLSSYTTGTFTTADLDDDGDTDIIYCGNNEFFTLENEYNNNNHESTSYQKHSFLEFGVDTCSLAYTVHNGTKYLALQGEHNSNATLFLLQVNSASNITLFNETDGLQNGDIAFVDIDGGDDIEIVNSGYISDTILANHSVFKINNTHLEHVIFNSTDLYASAIAYTTLPNENYPTILITGINGSLQNQIQAYQFNGTNLTTRNDLIEDVPAFSKGSMLFADITNNSYPDLFITGSNKAQLFTLFDTESTPPEIPKTPNITKATYSNNQLYIEWNTTDENVTFHLRVGERSQRDRFISNIVSTSTNPTQGQLGNMYGRNNFTLKNAPNTCYYIQVKAISPSYIHSNWSDVLGEVNKRNNLYDDGVYDINCDGVINEEIEVDGTTSTGGSRNSGGTITYIPSESEVNEEQNSKEETDSIKPTDQQPPEQPTETSQSSSKEEVPPLISQESYEKITTNTYSHKRYVETKEKTTRITETINAKEFALNNLSLRVFIPKYILRSAKDLNIIDPFVIIEDDPIIEFQESSLGRYKETKFVYAIDKTGFDPIDIKIQIKHNNISEQQKKEFNDAVNKSKDVLNVTKKVTTKDNETVYDYKIEFGENETILYNVSIFEDIPKCLIEIINEEISESDRDFEIINEDPMIVWHFDELLKGEEIQLKIKAIADTDCLDLGETISVAREIVAVKDSDEELNLKPPILLILLLLGFFLFIAHYTKERFHNERSAILVKKIKRGLRKKYKLPDIKTYLEKHHEDKEAINEAIDAVNHPIRRFFIKTAIGLESIILLALILLNILDFMKVLPGDIDFIKKIVSWILLALVFNHVGISKVLFGRRSGKIDTILLISFFLLTIKNFIGFAKATFTETEFVRDLYVYVINNNATIGAITFIAGFIGLLSVAIYLAFKKHIHKDSLMGALFIHHKESHQGVIKRFFQILLAEILFFLLVFNLMFEWLAIAVDAPILVLVIIITLITVIAKKIHSHYKESPMHIAQSITETPDHFYERLIELFHHPKFLPLGLAGMFVLHLVTEIGVYLIPYAFGFRDPLYINIYDKFHLPLFSLTGAENLFSISTAGFDSIVTSQYFFGYLGNIFALLLFLIIPIWVFSYELKHKNEPITKLSVLDAFKNHDSKATEIIGKIIMVVFPALCLIFVSLPAFIFKSIDGGLLAGVDIMTKQIFFMYSFWLLLVQIVIFLIASYYLSRTEKIDWMATTLAFSVLMVLFYDYLYLKSIVLYAISLTESFLPWALNWSLATNLSLSITVFLTVISIIAIYIISPLLLVFMFIPTNKKQYLYYFLPKHIRKIQNYYQIHYHHHHDDHIHGDKVDVVMNHIEKQLELGHELFVIVEHLKDYGWEWDIIEKAAKKLGKKKHYNKDIAFKRHKRHSSKVAIEKLEEWIIDKYSHGGKLRHIIDVLIKHGWDEDDIREALKDVKLKPQDKHLKHFLNGAVVLK